MVQGIQISRGNATFSESNTYFGVGRKALNVYYKCEGMTGRVIWTRDRGSVVEGTREEWDQLTPKHAATFPRKQFKKNDHELSKLTHLTLISYSKII